MNERSTLVRRLEPARTLDGLRSDQRLVVAAVRLARGLLALEQQKYP